jgi:hypothetical protein
LNFNILTLLSLSEPWPRPGIFGTLVDPLLPSASSVVHTQRYLYPRRLPKRFSVSHVFVFHLWSFLWKFVAPVGFHLVALHVQHMIVGDGGPQWQYQDVCTPDTSWYKNFNILKLNQIFNPTVVINFCLCAFTPFSNFFSYLAKFGVIFEPSRITIWKKASLL